MPAFTDPLDKPPAAVPAGALACERCGGGFHCGARDTEAPCACTTLRLSAAQRQALSERYSHCLCMPCLAEIAAGAPPESAAEARGAA